MTVGVQRGAFAVRDRKRMGDPPPREVVERRVRVEVRELDAGTAPERRARVIEVVVDELMSPNDELF